MKARIGKLWQVLLIRYLLLYSLALLVAVLLHPLSQGYLNTVLSNALASYGVTRALNALISVVQESSVSAGFVVEGNIALGQILDPINDLLERFSSLLLLSLVSVGVQKFILALGTPLSFIIVLISVAISLLGKKLVPKHDHAYTHRLLQGGMLLAVFVVLLVPVSSAIGRLPLGLEQRYQQAQLELQQVRQVLETEYGDDSDERRWFERLDIRQMISTMRLQSEIAIQVMVDLIVIFVIQTLIMPLLTLFILWRLVSSLRLPTRPQLRLPPSQAEALEHAVERPQDS